MRLLIHLKELLKKIYCSNCCSTTNTYENHDCDCNLCKNYLSNNLGEYNIDEYLSFNDENLYTQKEFKQRKEIHGNR